MCFGLGVRVAFVKYGPVIVLGPAAWDAFQDGLVRSG